MSDFLEDWDLALRSAREHGEVVWMRRFVKGAVLYPQTAKDRYEDEVGPIRWSGRTMHPSFMATPVAKHGPEREQ